MITEETLARIYDNLETEATKVIAVTIRCLECGHKHKKSLTEDGVRKKLYCHNIECDVEEFTLTTNLISDFCINHKVENSE